MSSSKIDKFTILCERNSGSHFLQYALLNNFNLTYVEGFKHFFGFSEPLSDDNLLTICIVRHPIDWIDSFFKRLHHIPSHNKVSIQGFICNEFYSIYEKPEDIKNKGYEIMEDRNFITGKRYSNIFELRKMKNEYFLNIIQNKIKNVCIIKYEDLRDDYQNTLNKLKTEFNLIPKNKNVEYMPIVKYKGTYTALYKLKPIILNDDIKQLILESVDKEQEKILGYDI